MIPSNTAAETTALNQAIPAGPTGITISWPRPELRSHPVPRQSIQANARQPRSSSDPSRLPAALHLRLPLPMPPNTGKNPHRGCESAQFN